MTAHRAETGQASVLMIGLAFAAVAATVVLTAFGQAYGARGHEQRAADLAAVSAAGAMRAAYPRLYEPRFLRRGVPNPRHLTKPAYLAMARAAAVRAARRNGARLAPGDVSFPDADPVAPIRVSTSLRAETTARVAVDDRTRRRRFTVRARATAELSPEAGAFGMPGMAAGGGYRGPLAYRQGQPMRPDVALAFDRLNAAARRAGRPLIVTSGFRSDAEQARLWRANPNPRWVARPGTSLHRLATELDLGPPGAYGWLAANARRFGFLKRYPWEPWHFGYIHNAGSRSVGDGGARGGGREPRPAMPSFVPARFAPAISRSAQRWNVSAALLAAQIYAESNFNPFARSPAGAQGIAQFMPGTARAYGLRNPFDAAAAIDAQGRMMRDLLRRFGSVPLALAAYNAGPGAVARCGCVPPYAETRAYVAKILGLMGGAGELPAGGLEVRLVE